MRRDWDCKTKSSRFAAKMAGVGKWLLLLLLPVLVFGLVMCKNSCTDPEQARRVLESEGHFTHIEFKDGYQWWTCGDGDAYATGFTAKNRHGKIVDGTVCCGWWAKDCTVRW